MLATFEVIIKDRPDWTESHTREAFKSLRQTSVGKPVYYKGNLENPCGFCSGSITLLGLKLFVEVKLDPQIGVLPKTLFITPYITLPFYKVVCFNLTDFEDSNLIFAPASIILEN